MSARNLPVTAESLPIEGAKWFTSIRLVRASGRVEERSADGEGALLLLTGTFDIQAGGGAWPGRGLRKQVFEGRPCAVFLPGNCRWRLDNGSGEVLLAQTRVPEVELLSPTENLQKKVLLPIAGSGKAFDPVSGEWRRQKEFALSPEAILPRQLVRTHIGEHAVETVFPSSYKALALCAAEAVVPAGAELTWPNWQCRQDAGRVPWQRESVYFLRTEGEARIVVGASDQRFRGDACVWTDDLGSHRVEAIAGRCYVAAFFAGPDKARALLPAEA